MRGMTIGKHKCHELQNYFDRINSNIDAICFQETKLKDSKKNYKFKGYQRLVIKNYLNSNGDTSGVLAIYVRYGINFVENNTRFNFDEVETLGNYQLS